MMATGFTFIAAAVVTVYGVVALVSGRSIFAGTSVPKGLGAGGVVVSGYYLAGLLGGIAYFPLQRVQNNLLGQMLLSFVLGFLAYGSLGLTAAIAISCCGIDVIGFKTPEEAWHVLPILSLGLAVLSGVLGPFVWRARS